jgi:hypothetical protein
MIIVSDTCTISYVREIDASRTLIDDSKVTLQIVASLLDDFRAIIYVHNMIIVQSTNLITFEQKEGAGK